MDGAEKADPADVKLFLAKCLDDHKNLCALVSRRTGLDRPKEYVIPLGPLDVKHAARLFARQCPQLHTANDRRKFTSALLQNTDDRDQSDFVRDDFLRDDRPLAAGPLDIIRAGLPGSIVAAAFSASRADLEKIISRASVKTTSPFTPIRDER